MGVLGLWDILESVGHPVKIEGLEGKVLGVDANIWLYKFIRGFRDKDNVANIESHKLGLFNRLCKLLFYRIKPVFVFDGPAPVLKRRTLERRQNIRNKHLMEYQNKAASLLAKQLKSQFPDVDIDHLQVVMPNLVSNNLVAAEKLTDEDRELFYLPDTGKLKADDEIDSDSSDGQDLYDDRRYVTTDVDINSEDFEHLPAETRYEILHDIKQERKRIRNPDNLPEDANSFSNYQLQRLKARRKVQEKIEKCEKEICTNYTGELADGSSIQAFRVQSDSRATILYRNNTYDPKALEKVKQEEVRFENVDEADETEEVDEKNGATSFIAERFKPKANVSSPRLIRTKEISIKRLANRLKSYKKIDKFQKAASPDLSSPEFALSPSGSESLNSPAPNLEEPISSQATQEFSQDQLSSQSNLSLSSPQDTNRVTNEIVEDPKDLLSSSDIPCIDLDDEAKEQSVKLHELKPTECTILIEDDSDSSDGQASFSDDQVQRLKNSGKVQDNEKGEDKPSSQSNLSLSSPQATNRVTNEIVEDPKDLLSSSDIPCIDLDDEAKEQSVKLHELKPTECTILIEDDSDSSDGQASFSDDQVQRLKNSGKVQDNEKGEDRPSSQSYPSSSQPRAANRVTNKIVEDAKELLRLFGIPYIDAAGEAEAQCAKLEELKLTEGTITDDSDIWLFGSQNVFRYFFNEDKYVMQYKMTDIEFHIRMTRENLVCFAMLVGSDYTDGIMNVGPVTALEVLSEFPGEGMGPLVQFQDWHKESMKDLKAAKKVVKRRKLLKYRIPDEFPSRAVYDGYMRPGTDTSAEKFTWGTPELDELREYARRNFGWDPKKVDDKLVPVMKKLNEKKIQKTIDTFFFKTQANRNPEMFRSKRVNQALNKIAKRAALEGKTPMVPDEVNLSEEDDD